MSCVGLFADSHVTFYITVQLFKVAFCVMIYTQSYQHIVRCEQLIAQWAAFLINSFFYDILWLLFDFITQL
jgi:hypothetical protein